MSQLVVHSGSRCQECMPRGLQALVHAERVALREQVMALLSSTAAVQKSVAVQPLRALQLRTTLSPSKSQHSRRHRRLQQEPSVKFSNLLFAQFQSLLLFPPAVGLA